MSIKKCLKYIDMQFITNISSKYDVHKYVVAKKISTVINMCIKYKSISYFENLKNNNKLDNIIENMITIKYERNIKGLFTLVFDNEYQLYYEQYNIAKTNKMRETVTKEKFHIKMDLESFIRRDGIEIGTTKYNTRSEKIKTNCNTSLDYYLTRGYNLEEATILQTERQKTFSLEKCIEKHGEMEGTKIWSDRQIKWQNTLNSKSDEEKSIINKKKSYN